MPELDIKWFASLGVGGILAWGMFFVYRKDMIGTSTRMEEILSELKQQRDLMVEVIQQNTAAMTRIEVTLDTTLREERFRHQAPPTSRRNM